MVLFPLGFRVADICLGSTKECNGFVQGNVTLLFSEYELPYILPEKFKAFAFIEGVLNIVGLCAP